MFVPKGRTTPTETIEEALRLHAAGRSTCEIARRLSLPQGSIANWCRGALPEDVARRVAGLPELPRCSRCGGKDHTGDPPDKYAYLLGVYLGDGWLSHAARTAVFCVACDTRYPDLIAEYRRSIQCVVFGRSSHLRHYVGKRCVAVRAYGNAWLCLFPQHGSGRKHHRRIALELWQQEIVDAHPAPFIRGLIQTDGWRGLNRVFVKGRWYEYPRYQFSSRSDDIRRLFTDACDRIGVAWRPWGRWHISVARREAVARLDEFVGPKS
jgi:hypothetical protein